MERGTLVSARCHGRGHTGWLALGPGATRSYYPRRRSATDSEADQEPECDRNGETRRVDEWNEARPGLGDLESRDRASAQAGGPATSAPLRPGLLDLAPSATRPKAVADTGFGITVRPPTLTGSPYTF